LQTDIFLEALADANTQKLRFIEKRNDMKFAHDHPEFFDDPPPPKDLASAEEVYTQALNAVVDHAIKLSRGEIDPPRFFDLAKATPPITLPEVRLHKKTVGGSFADWFIIKDDPSTPVADSRLANAIADVAKPLVNNFDDIKDPKGDVNTTLRLKGEALTNVLTDMTKINLRSAVPQLVSIAHLSTMLPNTITDLDLNINQLTDLGGLEHFTKLLRLTAFRNKIQSIAPLTSLTALKFLHLDTNSIEDLAALRASLNLVNLFVGHNQVSDLTPLGALVNLTDLDISANRIADLTPLGALVNLESLGIQANRIVDLSPLKSLTKLRGLVIDNPAGAPDFPPNPIEVATGLDGLTRIANPFFLADTLSVRFGRLNDGPASQFRGAATRIGRSNRFAVHLTRQTAPEVVKDDEWSFLIAGLDDRTGVITILVKLKSIPFDSRVDADGLPLNVARSFVSLSDPTRAVAGDPQLTRIPGISGDSLSFDAQVSAS